MFSPAPSVSFDHVGRPGRGGLPARAFLPVLLGAAGSPPPVTREDPAAQLVSEAKTAVQSLQAMATAADSG
jgi:hypothetical protein